MISCHIIFTPPFLPIYPEVTFLLETFFHAVLRSLQEPPGGSISKQTPHTNPVFEVFVSNR